MDRKLTQSRNPLNYRGVNAYQPPELVIYKRAPTIKDFANFAIGTIWLNNAGTYLTPPVPPSNSDIYMLVSVARNIGIWVSFGAPVPPPDTLTGNTGLAVGPDINNNINLFSGITAFDFKGNPAINTLTLESVSGNPLFQSMSDDLGIKVAPDLLGDIAILGTINRITTTGSLFNHNLTFDIDSSISSDFTANDGNTAEPVVGVLNVLGNNDILTSVPASDTIQIDISGTTNHALQLGNASGSLTSLGIATNGQLPIGSTGSNPVLNTLTAGPNISISNGAGVITINQVPTAKPVFFAYIAGASLNNVTGDGTGYHTKFDAKTIDTANSFDLTTGEYIIPITGTYYLGANISYRAKNNGAQEWGAGINPLPSGPGFGCGGGRPTLRFVNGFIGINNAIDLFESCFLSLTAGQRIYLLVEGHTRTPGGLRVDDLIGSNGIPGVGTCMFGYLVNL